MSTLTATKRRRPEVPVTGELDTNEFSLIRFAIAVGESQWNATDAYRFTLNGDPPRGWSLSPDLRAQTLQELEALAALERPTAPAHDVKQRRLVGSRVAESRRLHHIEGRGAAFLTYGNGFQIQWTPILTSPEMAVDYALTLLLDETLPWGKLFFRCTLPECRRFFIAERAKKKGQFRYKYCCPEHQKAADAATLSERVRRSQEKRRRQEAKANMTIKEYRESQARKHK